jgi:hypothetical protein
MLPSIFFLIASTIVTVLNCPYASMNGKFAKDGDIPRQYISEDKKHYLYFDQHEKRWSLSDDKMILCRTNQIGESDLPPAHPWEYWKVASASYISSSSMRLSFSSGTGTVSWFSSY